MSPPESPPPASAPDHESLILGTLLHLARRARQAVSTAELGYIAVNETIALAPYRQAALWLADRGIAALSGVVTPEANAPYVHWLESLVLAIDSGEATPYIIERGSLPEAVAAEWQDWLPAHGLWLPLPPAVPVSDGTLSQGGLLLARETPWTPGEIGVLGEWADIWRHAWALQCRPTALTRWRQLRRQLQGVLPAPGRVARVLARWRRPKCWQGLARGIVRGWRGMSRTLISPSRWRLAVAGIGRRLAGTVQRTWQRPRRRYTLIALAVLLLPVRLTILAPGELVPAHPAVIRAPQDGTVDRFFVAPNSRVKAGAPLFQLDLTTLTSRLEVARQGLLTAEAEYRQSAQQAVFDAKSKVQLALLQGRIAERKTETEFIEAQLARAQVAAPLDGIALLDDPSEWIGKPVVTGERIMTVADEHDVEVEAWIALGDGIDLPADAAVTLYLNAAPLSPVSARVRYYAHEAVPRPDASYAYRLRARLEPGESAPRVGMKGTAKIRGHWVPLAYWVLRRPLAILRQVVGL